MGIKLLKSLAFFIGMALLALFLSPSQREKGLLYTHAKHFAKARMHLEHYFNTSTKDAKNRERYMLTLLYEGDYETLEKIGKSLLKNNPNNFMVHKAMAKNYAYHMEFEKAEQHWLAMLKQYPHLRETEKKLVSSYIMRNKFDQLIDWYSFKIKQKAAEPEDYEFLLNMYLLGDYLDEAEVLALDTIAYFPSKQPKMNTFLAWIYEFRGETDKLIALYHEKFEMTPSLNTLLDLAHTYIAYQRPKKALALLKKYQVAFQNNPEILLLLSEIYVTLEEPEMATQTLEAIETPGSFYVRILQALVELYLKLKRPEPAIERLKRYHEKTGGDYQSYHLLGDLLATQGDESGSRTAYEKALILLREGYTQPAAS